MVDFIRKRLQVFVSSTFSDLISERQAAVEAILTAGHIPAGMELFTSGDESQMEVIKQWIDESDVFLLILGGRYGSLEPTTKKSYTQLEYEYAIAKSKPLFACAINEVALEQKVKKIGSHALETDNPGEMKAFRELVLTKMVRFWDDTKDIKIAIGETLSHFARRDDLAGWVRPHLEANMPALADEIARLSRENSLLREENAKNRTEQEIHGLSFSELSSLLEEEDLLSYLEDNQGKLATSCTAYTNDDDLKARKLVLHGLVTSVDYRVYTITNGGKAYLNKLALYRLKNPGSKKQNA